MATLAVAVVLPGVAAVVDGTSTIMASFLNHPLI